MLLAPGFLFMWRNFPLLSLHVSSTLLQSPPEGCRETQNRFRGHALGGDGEEVVLQKQKSLCGWNQLVGYLPMVLLMQPVITLAFFCSYMTLLAHAQLVINCNPLSPILLNCLNRPSNRPPLTNYSRCKFWLFSWDQSANVLLVRTNLSGFEKLFFFWCDYLLCHLFQPLQLPAPN